MSKAYIDVILKQKFSSTNIRLGRNPVVLEGFMWEPPTWESSEPEREGERDKTFGGLNHRKQALRRGYL